MDVQQSKSQPIAAPRSVSSPLFSLLNKANNTCPPALDDYSFFEFVYAGI
jgi:hypothetical protein